MDSIEVGGCCQNPYLKISGMVLSRYTQRPQAQIPRVSKCQTQENVGSKWHLNCPPSAATDLPLFLYSGKTWRHHWHYIFLDLKIRTLLSLVGCLTFPKAYIGGLGVDHISVYNGLHFNCSAASVPESLGRWEGQGYCKCFTFLLSVLGTMQSCACKLFLSNSFLPTAETRLFSGSPLEFVVPLGLWVLQGRLSPGLF